MVDSKLMKKFLLWIDRTKPETNTIVDFETFAIKQKVYARFGWGFRQWRFAYGQNVS
jgi:hypothetical protein